MRLRVPVRVRSTNPTTRYDDPTRPEPAQAVEQVKYTSPASPSLLRLPLSSPLAASPRIKNPRRLPTHPTAKNSGASTQPPASLLEFLLRLPRGKKQRISGHTHPKAQAQQPRIPRSPGCFTVTCARPGGVALELNAEGVVKKTMGFSSVDDDGWIFSPALWGDVDEASVRSAFDGASDGRLAITAVCRCCHREGRAVRFLDATKGRGAWVFGWYGAAARDVQVAADGGDLTVNWPLLGAARAHGRGIHLSVQDKTMPSIELSMAASMNDQQTAHLLFCVLAPGFPEVIAAGSPQSHPSNPLFRSGTDADALANPTWHIIWESSAGTQILPLYMVGFRPTQLCKRPGSPHEEASFQKKVRFSV